MERGGMRLHYVDARTLLLENGKCDDGNRPMTTGPDSDLDCPPPCREWWANCGVEADEEMREIDRLEDELSPLPENIARIRRLISTLEMCHHKAERWVINVIEAIGEGDTAKGLGTRSAGELHPSERDWINACVALSAWCAGRPASSVEVTIGGRPASSLLRRLGQRSALKEWQVQRVIERIREFIGWPRSMHHEDSLYVFLEECGADFEPPPAAVCPEHYREHEDFWKQTIEARIRDAVDGEAADLSLAVAIDLMFPCNWNFVDNLDIVLGAIGGELHSARPLAVCARNVRHAPIRERMQEVCRTLQSSLQHQASENAVDDAVLETLGDVTGPQKWLVASLDKTIRLQLGL